MRSPQRNLANKPDTSFTALKERAKQYFNGSLTSDVSQLLEDFCRESDRHVEEKEEKMKDLQEQVRGRNKFTVEFYFRLITSSNLISFMPFSLHEYASHFKVLKDTRIKNTFV